MIALWLAAAVLVLPGAGLSGTVRSSDAAPVSGALILVHQGGKAFTGTTNDRGEFQLPDVTLPATIEIHASGFTTVRGLVSTSPASFTLSPSAIRESIIVEGAAPAGEWRRASTGTTVLTSQVLATVPAVTLDEALRVTSGFSLFRRSVSRASNPTTHGVTMRGLSASGSSRGLVLLDGIPLTDGFGSWVTWTRVPALAVDSVEIDRGAQGSTFGSDALGGVLTLSTALPNHRAATARVTGGDLGIRALDFSGGAPRGDATTFGALSWFSTDGIVPTAPESAGPVDVRADAEWLNAFGKARFGTAVDQITVSAFAGRDDRGNGTPVQRNHMSGGTMTMAYDRLLSGTTFGARVSISPNSFRQSFSTVASSRQSETFTSTQFITTTTTRVGLELGHVLKRGYVTARLASARTGASFLERRTSTSTNMQLRDDSDALSVHAGWPVRDSISLGFGVRREWRAAPRSDSDRDAATVAHVSGSWRLSQRFAVRAAAAGSHRWPTLNEMVRNFQVGAVLTRANANLLPERAVSGDVALSAAGSHWHASAGGFWTVVEDAIANFTVQSTPTIIRERRNAGEAHARGLELDGDIRPIEALTIRASALVVDSRFRHSIEPVLEGNWLPQVPKVSTSVSGDLRVARWGGSTAEASFSWRSVGAQFDDDRNVFQLADAQQLDLKFRAGTQNIFGEITIENATDARIEVGKTPLVTIAPGRAVRAGVTWRLR